MKAGIVFFLFTANKFSDELNIEQYFNFGSIKTIGNQRRTIEHDFFKNLVFPVNLIF